MRAVERRDERLNDADGAVISAGIAPGFEVVRFGNVPVAILRSLVEMRADMNDGLNLFALELFVKAQLGGKIEIVRRCIDGVDAENQQCRNLALVNVGAELTERFQVIDGVRLDRLRVIEGGANV